MVGIDASLTSTGMYVMRLDGGAQFFPINIKTNNKEGSEIFRIHRVASELISCVSDFHRVGMVAIEDYGPINKFSGKLTQRAEIIGILKYALHDEMGIPFCTVPPKALKSFACGNGNASKQDMINKAKEFGFFTDSHDLADAFHLARFAQALIRGSRVGVAYQLFKP